MTAFCLRPWQETDAVSLVRYADDPGIAANLRDVFPSPYTRLDADNFIRDCLEREGRDQLSRAVVIGGQAVGCITVTRGQDVYCRNGELGYWLGRPFWSRGVMTAAVRQICREAFAAFDLVRIQAEVYTPNKASQVVLEKAGFALEGVRHCGIYKNGQLLDSCLYALLKEEEA